MSPNIIAYAVLGSTLAELAAAYYYLCRKQKLPSRYHSKAFYVIRGCLALGAGVLPAVFAVATPYSAFALGIGAPIIINRIGRAFTEE